MIFWLILLVVLAAFALIAFVGAPYVPTHKAAIVRALDMLPLKPGDRVVDLGSGDGRFLLAAAKRGLRATGYELNPFLYVFSALLCFRFRGQVSIELANFWTKKLPSDTKAVFVFGAGPFMQRLAKKLRQRARGDKALYVISYGFELPGLKPMANQEGLYMYKLAPVKR